MVRRMQSTLPAAPARRLAPLAIGPHFRSRRHALLACSALSLVVALPVPHAQALPQNGTITEGSGSITTNGNTLTVTQNSDKLVIDWSSFNIAAGEQVIFVQADQLMQVLNRVLGSGASTILGQLSAKGTVIITNPNGILFGNGAQVNVGAIIATTSGITNANFLAGKLNFDIPSTSDTASVVNRGTITAAEAGLVGLVAPGVENSGVIQARLGVVQMAAGNTFTIDLYGDKLIKLAVGDTVTRQVKAADGRNLDALAANAGTLSADGGTVFITAAAARDVVRNVINMDGVAQARSVGGADGEIVLDGGSAGTVRVAGTLDAGGANSGEAGGAVTVLGDDIAVVDGAKLLAAGNSGGGTVKIGSWDSASASLAAGSAIDASATGNGNGGRVELIAQTTTARGAISAEGGAEGGDGGFIETSGHSLDISGIQVSARAPKGKAGDWLLDPYDLTVNAAAAASITTALAGANVTLQTTAGGSSGFGAANASGSGDITINAAITWSADTTLVLDAYRSVQVNAAITATGAGSGLTVLTNNGGSGGDFYADAPVTLPTTASLSIDGQTYALIDSLSALTDLAGRYALVRDITLSGTQTAMGTLTGTLEGLGHTIGNLTINAPGSNLQGLFGQIGNTGTVRNLGLVGGSVSGNAVVGMLAGRNLGRIVNSYATGAVSGTLHTGGLVGFNDSGGTVSASYATGTVSGSNTAGGLVGYNYAATVTSSYATGAVSGISNVGGLVGNNSPGGTVVSSYATGAANGNFFVGGLVGSNYGTITSGYATGPVGGTNVVGGLVGYNQSGSTVASSYWDKESTGQNSGAGANDGTFNAVGLTTADALQASSYSGWDFTDTWTMVDGYTRPFLRSEYSTVITNAHQLQLVHLDPNASYTLATDIVMPALTDSGMWAVATGFVPIGFSTIGSNSSPTQFTGTFDGAGHTITGLTIKHATSDNIGLFSAVDSYGTVRNLGLVGGSVDGKASVGMLAGRNAGSVTNSYSTGAVSGTGAYVGGLVGFNGGTVSASYATGAVSGTGGYVGGLVGLNHFGGTVSASYATGAVSGIGLVGGLVGGNAVGGTVVSSYATGAVSGNYYVGGLVGNNAGTVTSSYATGAVSGTGAYVGGLVGENFGAGTVTSSYATGAVSGIANVGGLAGNNAGTVTSSYWDNESTGQNSGAGINGGTFGATGLTTADSKVASSYEGWDFDDTWYLPNDGTPILRTSPYVLTIVAGDATMTYGDAVPALTASYSNLWVSDTANVVSGLTLATSATSTSPAGTYAVTGSGATAISSTGQAYFIIYKGGTLTVLPRAGASDTTLINTVSNLHALPAVSPSGGSAPGQRLVQASFGGGAVDISGGGPKLTASPELLRQFPSAQVLTQPVGSESSAEVGGE